MAKMGRPKKDVKKEKVISLRLTDEIYQKLLAYISDSGQTKTEVILRAFSGRHLSAFRNRRYF